MLLGLRCFGQTLIVTSSSSDVMSYITSLKRIHVFLVSHIELNHSLLTSPKFNYEEGSPTSLSFDVSTSTMYLRAKWCEINHSGTIENLLGQLLGISCLNNCSLPIHASAVSTERGAFLFIGKSGSGKTNLAFSLYKRGGYKWISNDYLAVGLDQKNQLVVLQQDDFLDFRKLSFSDMVSFLPIEITEKICSRFPISDSPRVKSSPPFLVCDLNLESMQLPCPVQGLFFPSISQTSFTFIDILPPSCVSQVLIQEILSPVRGLTSSILNNHKEVISISLPLEPQLGWANLNSLINKLAFELPAYELHAPLSLALDFVSLTIAEILED